MRLVVTPNQVEVVAPLGVAKSQIHAFVAMKQDWVIKVKNKFEVALKTEKKEEIEQFTTGVLVSYQGQKIKMSLYTSSLAKVKVELSEQEFKVYLPDLANLLDQRDKSEMVRLAIIDWMQQQAIKQVENYAEAYAKKYNLYPRTVKIKTQKSRWGSCGIHNDIHINWSLIMAPSEVLEYVVVHELCHIKERNHSANFWNLVAKQLPEYQKQRNWLKQHGYRLMQGL